MRYRFHVLPETLLVLRPIMAVTFDRDQTAYNLRLDEPHLLLVCSPSQSASSLLMRLTVLSNFV